MNANLPPIREQIDLVRCDQRLAMTELRQHLLTGRDRDLDELDEITGLSKPVVLLSRIAANIHELELLHKRELSLIETGREPQEEAAKR